MEGTLLGCRILLSNEPLTRAIKKRFLARTSARSTKLLLQALAEVGFEASRINTTIAELGELERSEFAPQPLITGDDLTAAGLQPGPAFKKVLDYVYDEQLEGRLTEKTSAMKIGIEFYQRVKSGK
jgi:poly(A) polymerase